MFQANEITNKLKRTIMTRFENVTSQLKSNWKKKNEEQRDAYFSALKVWLKKGDKEDKDKYYAIQEFVLTIN